MGVASDMRLVHYTEVPAEEADGEAKGVKVRWLISKETGAPNFAMRLFEVEPGGYTPHHTHPWEHEIYILSGRGLAVGEEGEKPIKPGDVIYIPPGERHQLRNNGDKPLRFLCLIPIVD